MGPVPFERADKRLALPLYHQVAAIVRQRIVDGVYAEGERLDSEDKLAAEFNVSRATMRQAMGDLVSEGLVIRKQGFGTIVGKRLDDLVPQRFHGSLTDLIGESGRAKVRTVKLSHDTFLTNRVAELLQLDQPTGTIVRRTRTMAGEPFAYTVNYLPTEFGRLLSVAKLRTTSLMGLLIRAGIELTSATQSVHAQLADLDLHESLGVQMGSAVLFVERIVKDKDERPVQLVRSWYRGDRYAYVVNLGLSTDSDQSLHANLA